MEFRIFITGLILLFITYLWVGQPASEMWMEQLTTMIRNSLIFLQKNKMMVTGGGVVAIVALFITYQKA